MRVTLKPRLETGERMRVWLWGWGLGAGGSAPDLGKWEKGPQLRLCWPWSKASMGGDELRSERPDAPGC